MRFRNFPQKYAPGAPKISPLNWQPDERERERGGGGGWSGVNGQRGPIFNKIKNVLYIITNIQGQTALLKTCKRRADDELVGPQICLQPC